MVHDDYRYSNYYTGLKLDGKWQGFGIGIIESTGNYYVGEILDDYRDGYGRVFLKSGVEDGSLNGIYRNGKYIRKAD